MTLTKWKKGKHAKLIKKLKYNNKKVIVDGIVFDSKAEADRYGVLRALEKANYINDLKLQVPFKVKINDQFVCTYKADFVYEKNGKKVVEDVKGFETPLFRLKKKIVEAYFGIEIKLFKKV